MWARPSFRTQQLLWLTTALLLPGALVQASTFGFRTLVLLAAGIGFAMTTEALCQKLSGMALDRRRLADGSSALTGALIALCLPPDTPLLVLALGCAVGLGLGKFAYGGLGNNLFNPAMVGYAAVLVAFPEYLTSWPTETAELSPDAAAVDGLSGATPLDAFQYRGGSTVADFEAGAAFGQFAGVGWEGVNGAFLAGGLVLLALRITHWRVPLAVFAGLGLAALAGYDSGSSSSGGGVLFHWLSGATCLTAFFIATDPVTQPSDPRAQWCFGLLVGVLIYGIRYFGTYADGAAFAILLGNGCAPLLQQQFARLRRKRLHPQTTTD